MNAQFEELAQALGIGDRAGALVDALYVLRAPKSLTGIIPMAREFRDWRAQFPGLNALDVISNYRQCLELLDRIADLECEDETLTGEILARRAHSLSTPCRPYTGDSVIGELLLIRAQSEGVHHPFCKLA